MVAGDLLSAQPQEVPARAGCLPAGDRAGIPGRVSEDLPWVALINSSNTRTVEQSAALHNQIPYLNFLRFISFQKL